MSDDDLAIDLERLLLAPDDAAAKVHLAAGRPIYFAERDTPTGTVIKEFPDGHRELVRFDEHGEHPARRAA